MKQYEKQQLDKLTTDKIYEKINIKLSDSFGNKTNVLSITKKQFEQIKNILTI